MDYGVAIGCVRIVIIEKSVCQHLYSCHGINRCANVDGRCNGFSRHREDGLM